MPGSDLTESVSGRWRAVAKAGDDGHVNWDQPPAPAAGQPRQRICLHHQAIALQPAAHRRTSSFRLPMQSLAHGSRLCPRAEHEDALALVCCAVRTAVYSSHGKCCKDWTKHTDIALLAHPSRRIRWRSGIPGQELTCAVDITTSECVRREGSNDHLKPAGLLTCRLAVGTGRQRSRRRRTHPSILCGGRWAALSSRAENTLSSYQSISSLRAPSTTCRAETGTGVPCTLLHMSLEPQPGSSKWRASPLSISLPKPQVMPRRPSVS